MIWSETVKKNNKMHKSDQRKKFKYSTQGKIKRNNSI